jgi:hypothetical protein
MSHPQLRKFYSKVNRTLVERKLPDLPGGRLASTGGGTLSPNS